MKLLARLLVLLLAVLLAFGLLELAIRAFVVQSNSLVFTQTHHRWLATYWLPINAEGYRDETWTEENLAGKTRIIVVGDSFPSGLGVNDFRDTFPKVMQARLGDDYAVMLVAEPGWGPDNMLPALLDYPYQADALVLSYYINDIVPACQQIPDLYPSLEFNPPSYLATLVNQSHLVNFLYWDIYNRILLSASIEEYTNGTRACYAHETVWNTHEQELQAIYNWTLIHEIPLVVVLFPDMANPLLFSDILAQVRAFFEARKVLVIDESQTWATYPYQERIINPLDSHPSLRIHAELGEMLADLDILQNPTNPGYKPNLADFIPSDVLANYQENSNPFNTESYILNPVQGSALVSMFRDITQSLLQIEDQNADNQHKILLLMDIWQQSERSATQTNAQQYDAIIKWAETKDAEVLRTSHIDYILTSRTWDGWLSEEIYEQLYNGSDYQIIQEWQLPNSLDSYRLLQVR